MQYKLHIVTTDKQHSSGVRKQVLVFTAFINDMENPVEWKQICGWQKFERIIDCAGGKFHYSVRYCHSVEMV